MNICKRTLTMFPAPAQRRLAKREPKSLYEAVVALRRRGVKVYRGGYTITLSTASGSPTARCWR